MNVKTGHLQLLQKQLSQNNGRITSKEAEQLGIHRMYLKNLTDNGILIRTGRGIYQKPDILNDELYDLQSEYTAGIFSLETALYLYNLAERAPLQWTMTFKGKYHSEKLKQKGIIVKLVKDEIFDIEVNKVMSPGKHLVKAYSAERTLCEILSPHALCDIQTISYAYKTYSKWKNKNLQRLIELAKLFKVENKARSYIEVLT